MPDAKSFPKDAPSLELGPNDILRVPERCPHNAPARIAKTVRDGEDEPKRWRTIVDYACSYGCHVLHVGPMWPDVVRTADTNRRLAILG